MADNFRQLDFWFPFICLLGVADALLFFGILKSRRRWQQSRFAKAAISLFIFGIAWFNVEIWLWATASSDNLAVTLSHREWVNRHWRPINTLGYRDTEPPKEKDPHRRYVLVVGDSIASGQGIENIEDRLGGVLQRRLGDDFVVHTVADPGWDSPVELNQLVQYPIRPDVVVLAYCSGRPHEFTRCFRSESLPVVL